MTGLTYSTNYDITPGASQTTNGGYVNVFLTKLDLSGTTSINSVHQNRNVFSVCPNPNKGQFVIQSEKGGVFEIIDIIGRVIESYVVQSPVFELYHSLPPGMYIVRETRNGFVEKLVIE